MPQKPIMSQAHAGDGPGRFGRASFQPGEAVELLADDGHPHRAGLVARAALTPLGWRYDVHTNAGRFGGVTDWNLRGLAVVVPQLVLGGVVDACA